MTTDLPILHSADLVTDAPRTVLLTGATGNIGAKLRAAWSDRYELILLDLDAKGDAEILAADLARWDEAWLDLLDETDVVVHLAANSSPEATWPELIGPNLDAVANLCIASALAGVERVILASSTHVIGGSFTTLPPPYDDATIPQPPSPYGSSKLFGERIGRSIARAFGVSVLALRLGWCQQGENRCETLPNEIARRSWLSNRDVIHLFTRAVEADLEPGTFLASFACSNNSHTPWHFPALRRLIGYEPQDNACP
jgi:dTDP-4-dehydrorhamnose reductase